MWHRDMKWAKNGIDRLAQHRDATNLQSVENAVSVMDNKWSSIKQDIPLYRNTIAFCILIS